MTSSITPLPPPPSRADPANFRSRADAFHGALPTFALEANALGADVSGKATAAAASAAAAIDAAHASNVLATAAANSANAAGAAASAPAWAGGAPYAVGMTTWSPANGLVYRCRAPGAGTQDPSTDPEHWQIAANIAPQLIETNAANINASAGGHYVLTFPGLVTIGLPVAPNVGDILWITPANGRADTLVVRNGRNIAGLAEDLVIDDPDASAALRYIDTTIGWRIVA